MILTGKNILITGGSRGIGRALAQTLVKHGAQVLLAARNQEELLVARAALGPQNVLIYRADISQALEVEKLFEFIKKEWHAELYGVINAAAIYGPKGPIEDMAPDTWFETLTINVYGSMLVIREAIPLMKDKRQGVIINFSGGGEGAFPRFSAYAASKGAIVRLTETVAEEVKPWDIRVNAIAPGPVNTRLLEEVLSAGPDLVGSDFYEHSLKQKKTGGTSPEKAAELCVFLMSDASLGLTGRTISAVWDNYKDIPKHLKDIMHSDVYTWRRIKPKDRGYVW